MNLNKNSSTFINELVKVKLEKRHIDFLLSTCSSEVEKQLALDLGSLQLQSKDEDEYWVEIEAKMQARRANTSSK